MTFQIKIGNSKILKGIIETLSSIIEETQIHVDPNEFTITAMDPSRICILKFTMKKEHFDGYKCKKEANIGINLQDLDKILKRSSANDSITLDFEENDQKVKIKMNRDKSLRTRTFSLALLDLDYEEIPIDNLLGIEYSSKGSIDSSLLIEACKDAEIYSEVLTITSREKKGLAFQSSGQIGEMNYEVGIDELKHIELSGEDQSTYSLTFLKSILKAASITKHLEFFLRQDHPLKLIFELETGGELLYFLAPRVDQEEYTEDDNELNDLAEMSEE